MTMAISPPYTMYIVLGKKKIQSKYYYDKCYKIFFNNKDLPFKNINQKTYLSSYQQGKFLSKTFLGLHHHLDVLP